MVNKPKNLGVVKIQMMEIDEMHSYIGSKKTIFGLLLTDMRNGLLTLYQACGTEQLSKGFGLKCRKKAAVK